MIKLINVLIAGIISVSFFLIVSKPPSYFNFLPFAIHDYFWPGGKNETQFIIGFDAIVSIGLFVLVYFILRRVIGEKFNRRQ